MSHWLESEDLFKLTGYRQKGRQIAQLRKMGVVFRTNASGHPVVTWAAVEGRASAAAPTAKTWEPAWAGIHP